MKPKQRIGNITGWFMIGVAGLFDVFQVASKLLIIFGLTILGAGAGAIVGDFIGLEETFAALGALVGGVVTAIGPGLAVGAIMSELASWFFATIGWSTMYLWFHFQGVSTLGGKNIEKKMAVSVVTFIVDFIPFLNALPGITIWTYTMVKITQTEDKAANKAQAMRYNIMNRNAVNNYERRGGRRPERNYVSNDDTEETV